MAKLLLLRMLILFFVQGLRLCSVRKMRGLLCKVCCFCVRVFGRVLSDFLPFCFAFQRP